EVAGLKLRPSRRVVVEPFPQLGRGRHVLRPMVDRGRALRKTTRPDAVHEDAIAVVGRGRVINPLDGDMRHGLDLCPCRSPSAICGSVEENINMAARARIWEISAWRLSIDPCASQLRVSALS